MRIIGTAGHVDHGKSSLVISLTGHNPDRWVEERERGTTLDLGFAPLRFSDGLEAGIIDVPGHERFLHNMLAGAAGIDLLLLVIDAVEGPRAQTLEHLQILNFLNVQRALIVLTKVDLIDADAVRAAAARALDACAGTVAAGAAVLPVSNVTGHGIDALKSAIHDALRGLAPTRTNAPAYLPVDRVFALQGHGTIVTGTLMQGSIRPGDVLTMQPSGQPARVRSLQIFGRKVNAGEAGSRLAVNVPGIDASSIRRGDVLAASREFEPDTELFVEFSPLAEALPLMRKRMPVRVHIGAAEIEGRLILDERPTDRRAVRGRVSLSRPTVFYRGTRMILRRLSPKDLLGGAIVTDRWSDRVAIDHGTYRIRDAATEVGADADGASAGAATASAATAGAATAGAATGGAAVDGAAVDGATADDETCFAVIEAAGIRPIAAQKVPGAANVRETIASAAIGRLLENGRIVAIAKPLEYVSRAAADAAFDRAEAALRDRHVRAPWRLGCSAPEIASALGVDDALALRLLSAWNEDGRLAQRARFWHLPDFTPSLTREQRMFFDTALAGDGRVPMMPVSHEALAKAADAGRIAGAREALDSLIATGALVRVGDDLYRRTQMERARALVVDVMRDNTAGATTSQLREALGISRKHALPLMEHFDSVGLTVRTGDVRRLRNSAGTSPAPIKV